MWLLFLLLAWVVAVVSCVRVCRTALAAGLALHRGADATADADARADDTGAEAGLTLYETAYLAGGPHRLADVVLVLMAQQRRLHLAHTGWATVVDPVGQDPVERAALSAIGPEGQRRIPAVRRALTSAEAVRGLADRLVHAGLAAPPRSAPGSAPRSATCSSPPSWCCYRRRHVLGGAVRRGRPAGAGLVRLPAGADLGTWAVARAEAHPYTAWATEAGSALLRHEHPGGPSRRPACRRQSRQSRPAGRADRTDRTGVVRAHRARRSRFARGAPLFRGIASDTAVGCFTSPPIGPTIPFVCPPCGPVRASPTPEPRTAHRAPYEGTARESTCVVRRPRVAGPDRPRLPTGRRRRPGPGRTARPRPPLAFGRCAAVEHLPPTVECGTSPSPSTTRAPTARRSS
ncbi:TIGR04222 domain-containing membrane protein [Streptomyces albulus]|nr:TIGR04222 domain-containing membrane protein [Streptomyces noursei]